MLLFNARSKAAENLSLMLAMSCCNAGSHCVCPDSMSYATQTMYERRTLIFCTDFSSLLRLASFSATRSCSSLICKTMDVQLARR